VYQTWKKEQRKKRIELILGELPPRSSLLKGYISDDEADEFNHSDDEETLEYEEEYGHIAPSSPPPPLSESPIISKLLDPFTAMVTKTLFNFYLKS